MSNLSLEKGINIFIDGEKIKFNCSNSAIQGFTSASKDGNVRSSSRKKSFNSNSPNHFLRGFFSQLLLYNIVNQLIK